MLEVAGTASSTGRRAAGLHRRPPSAPCTPCNGPVIFPKFSTYKAKIYFWGNFRKNVKAIVADRFSKNDGYANHIIFSAKSYDHLETVFVKSKSKRNGTLSDVIAPTQVQPIFVLHEPVPFMSTVFFPTVVLFYFCLFSIFPFLPIIPPFLVSLSLCFHIYPV
jgi:hypothetical protein